MQNTVKIRRYIINNTNENRRMLLTFFSGKRWKEIEKEKFYCTKYTSEYFQLEYDQDNIYIDSWNKGSFGVIMPAKYRVIGIADQIGHTVISDFEYFFKENKILFEITTTNKKGVPQYQYLLLCILIAVVLGTILTIL